MRSRRPPDPDEYRIDRRALANDRQVKVWLQRLAGSKDPQTLPKRDIEFVLSEIVKRRGDQFRGDLVLDELRATCPVLAYPEMTDVVEDLGHMFGQPEMVRFWGRVQGEKQKKGPTPCFGWTKALMAVLAMTGKTTHGTDAFDLLANMPGLREVFAQVDARAIGLAEREGWTQSVRPERWTQVPTYSSMMRNIERLSETIRTEGIAVNIEMLKALKRRYPDVGRRLLIDGTDVPAWVPQQWAERDSDRDKVLRRRVSEAGYRAYAHSSRNGKQPLKEGDVGAGGRDLHKVKGWRGFYFVTLIDQATGLPIVWTLFDSSQDEAAAIVPLLSELYHYWPDLDAEVIVGDSAWDEDQWCELAERSYGIHPVFRLHPSSTERRISEEHMKLVEGRFISLGGDGRACCTHNELLPYETAEVPRREGLRPGQLHPKERSFRVRFRCQNSRGPHGRPGMPMCVDWSRLTYYPHHPYGHPQRYATRLALLRRLNQIESWHHHLEAGLRLGTEGADRSRLAALAKQEALLTLGAIATTALALADQRLNHGLPTPVLPSLPPAPSAPASPSATPSPTAPRPRAGSNGHRRPRREQPPTQPAAPREARAVSVRPLLPVVTTPSGWATFAIRPSLSSSSTSTGHAARRIA